MCGQPTGLDGSVFTPSIYRVAVTSFFLGIYYIFPFSFSAYRLLQWTVVQTTSGKGEVYRILRATRSCCCHRVNNGGHDLGAAQAQARYRLRLARRITRFPARFHAGVSAGCGRCFQSHVACTLSAPHSDERTSDGPGARSARDRSVAPVRCNFLPQARDIIVNRPTRAMQLYRKGRAPLYRAAQRVL